MKALNIQVSKGKHDLTTNARRKVMGRNKQLDEGAGRQTWKCHDPLNCIASVAFRKHGSWVQIWIWPFWGTLHKSAVPRHQS